MRIQYIKRIYIQLFFKSIYASATSIKELERDLPFFFQVLLILTKENTR